MQSQEHRMYLYGLKTLLKNEQYFLNSKKKIVFVRGFMDSESCSVAWDTNLFVALSSQ